MKVKKLKGLVLQFVTFSELEDLDTKERIKKLLDIILNGKILVLQGRLSADEEARLIEDTMVLVGRIKGFKGVELAVIEPNTTSLAITSKIRYGLAKALVRGSGCLTIIGPASIVKEIRRDPRKIELMFNR